MPHAGTIGPQLTEDYLEAAIERLRECLRDLKKVNDRPTALAVRERCAHRMQQAVTTLKELRDERDGLLVRLEKVLDELEERKADKTELLKLVDKVFDVERRIITPRELVTWVAERYDRYD